MNHFQAYKALCIFRPTRHCASRSSPSLKSKLICEAAIDEVEEDEADNGALLSHPIHIPPHRNRALVSAVMHREGAGLSRVRGAGGRLADYSVTVPRNHIRNHIRLGYSCLNLGKAIHTLFNCHSPSLLFTFSQI